MYQVLYRKWRPKTFSDVVGQPQVTETLKNELNSGRISHAYLFTGSRGTGKTTCAKILAQAINCLDSKDGDPCGECEICKGIANGSIMDVVEIDAASNNGVENIRNLREEAFFTPSSSKYRVYIIDEVHMLSIGAFNALLKTLEEPPSHVVFILATTEVHKLPATILSRCQRFDFHRIDPNEIAKRLDYVTKREGHTIEYDAALLIAHISDGALRDALSLLDQCIGKADAITSKIVTETAGLAGHDYIISLSKAILDQDTTEALNIINELHRSSKDMMRLSEELTDHFRNLMLKKTMKNPRDLIVVSDSEYKEIEEQSKNTSLESILHIIDSLQSSLESMNRGSNKRIQMELSIIKISSPKLDYTLEALISRVEKLEKQLKSKTIVSEQKLTTDKKLAETPASLHDDHVEHIKNDTPKNITSKKPLDISELQKNAKPMKEWPEVLTALKAYSKAIATAFNGSTAYTSDNYVLIDSPNTMAFELLRKSAQRDKMRVAIQEITGKLYKLGPYKRSATSLQEAHPLDELAKLAEDAGINVTKN